MYWNFSSMEAWNGRNQMFFLFANYTEIIFIRLTPEYKLVRINKAKNLRNAIPKGESGLLSFSPSISFTLYLLFFHLLSLLLFLFPSIWLSFNLPVFFFLFLWSQFLFLLLFLHRIIVSVFFSPFSLWNAHENKSKLSPSP